MLFYFNPRFGLYFIESVIKGEPHPPGIFGWVSAAWVLALGLLPLSGRMVGAPAYDPYRPVTQGPSCEPQSHNLWSRIAVFAHSALIPNSLMTGHHFSISAF